MAVVLWRARIEKHAEKPLSFQDSKNLFRYLRRFKDGTLLDVAFHRVGKLRSLAQNRYYWGVVIKMIADEIGEDPETVHEAMKFKFLATENPDLQIQIVRSTTDLTIFEVRDYWEKIQRWASEFLNCIIPDPNQVEY